METMIQPLLNLSGRFLYKKIILSSMSAFINYPIKNQIFRGNVLFLKKTIKATSLAFCLLSLSMIVFLSRKEYFPCLSLSIDVYHAQNQYLIEHHHDVIHRLIMILMVIMIINKNIWLLIIIIMKIFIKII